ncbi:hypothetical protein EDD36DRAFT_473612 [Exophiala viscosa]|uniref:DUF7605 domain-containing protein n=1 Tax=Exophiala viscosa TaxID=2486360 RepID=A0AAN6DVT6_9EURO|nr:hypothetical protein EDD36DRAFT_473612 [Exophiala viscosa]
MDVLVKQETDVPLQAGSMPEYVDPPPYLDPPFVRAGDLARQTACKIHDIYSTAPRPPPSQLISEAEGLAKHLNREERLVGLVGLSGSGKSSLICALLQTEGIAIIDGSGKAVTCFPVEYRHSSSQHTSKYHLQCAFPDQPRVEELLSTYLDDIIAPTAFEHDELTASEWEEVQSKARTAEAVFVALFTGLDGFTLKKLNPERRKVTRKSAIKLLHEWAKHLPWPAERKDSVWSSEAATEEELRELLTKFRDNGLWPLIDSMTIFMGAPLLRHGVVLIDLPGYQDSNLARVKAARQAQAKCDDLLVVAGITRVVDSPILDEAIEENIARPDIGMLTLQTVTAVCTHSAEAVDPRALRAADDKIKELKKRDASYSEMEEAKLQKQHLIIEARNKNVIAEMELRHGSRLPKDQFQVFCVDSTKFFESKEWEDMSGIPALQSYVKTLPGKTLFQLSNAYIGPHLQAMVASFESYVDGSRLKPGTMKAVLHGPEALERFDDELELWTEEIVSKFESIIIDPLKDTEENIDEALLEVVQSWRALHGNTVGALCRKGGKLHTVTAGKRDWNAELTECITNSTDEAWSEFDDVLEASLSGLHQKICEAFQDYPVTCKKLGAPEHFLQSLLARQQILDDLCAKARESFRKELGTIKKNANNTHENAYVRACMLPVYKIAGNARGKGVKEFRHTTLEEHVEECAFVASICDSLETDFQDATEREHNNLVAKVASTVKSIQTDVDLFQGKKDEIPLFKLDPKFGERAEELLQVVKQRRVEIDGLAEPARNRARQLYGDEIMTWGTRTLEPEPVVMVDHEPHAGHRKKGKKRRRE